MITNSNLHYTILRYVIDNGFAPSVEELCEILNSDLEIVIQGLYDLQEYHGVVLHPDQPKIWVIHPFSLSPTNFYVTSHKGEWWGNCAWCSLGIATIVDDDVKILTTIGAETTKVELNIINGVIQEDNYLVHFPIPMQNAWDNVIYTCSNMLIFENEKQVKTWCKKHNMPLGDIQPIDKIWRFSQRWYGQHLNPDWKKWTVQEAKAIFEEFDLSHKIWNLDDSKTRF